MRQSRWCMCSSKLRNVSGREYSLLAWPGEVKERLRQNRCLSWEQETEGTACGGPVTGGSLEHFRDAEETSVSWAQCPTLQPFLAGTVFILRETWRRAWYSIWPQHLIIRLYFGCTLCPRPNRLEQGHSGHKETREEGSWTSDWGGCSGEEWRDPRGI